MSIEVGQKLWKSFLRSQRGISVIEGARRAKQVLVQSGRHALESEAQTAPSALRSSNPQHADLFIQAIGGEAAYSRMVFGHQTSSLEAIIDSSALVFMHAVLDYELLEYCREI